MINLKKDALYYAIYDNSVMMPVKLIFRYNGRITNKFGNKEYNVTELYYISNNKNLHKPPKIYSYSNIFDLYKDITLLENCRDLKDVFEEYPELFI